MSILIWSLLCAALLVILSKAPAMFFINRETTGYDNHHPREQQAQMKGAGARALAAHQNTIESFPLFAAGILVAELAAEAHLLSATLAVAFIVARVLYIVCYVKDMATLRSLVWAAGYLCSIGLILAPWYAG